MDNKKQGNDLEGVKQLFGSQPQNRSAQTTQNSLNQDCAQTLLQNQIIKDGKLDKFEEYFKDHIESTNDKFDKLQMSQILFKLIENYNENREHQQCAVFLMNKVEINPNYHPLDEDNGVTVLMKASQKQMVQVVKSLLQNKDVQINKTDKRGESALIHSIRFQKASGQDHLQVIELLLEHGANPNIKYIDEAKGEIPLLHACVINQWAETVDLLLKYKIDVDAIDKQGDTATHIAARKQKRKDILESLLSVNPNLKIQNNNSQTALEVAYEDKKGLIQSKIQEEEEKLRLQQLEDQNNNQNIQVVQEVKQNNLEDILATKQEEKQTVQNSDIQTVQNQNKQTVQNQDKQTVQNQDTQTIQNQDKQAVQNQDKQIVQNQQKQTMDSSNEKVAETQIKNEIIQEDQQKSQNTQQQNQSQQQNAQQSNYKSEDEGSKNQNSNQQVKEQKEQTQENSNVMNGLQQQQQQQPQQAQNNQNVSSSQQSKKQLNQASTEFQLNSQQVNQTPSQQNNLQNNIINQNQQTNFSSPTQSFNSMQNIKANNNINTNVTNQSNLSKNPQFGQQIQNYSGQQHVDRSKNLQNQQLQQGQITTNVNRGNTNFNYTQKSPINQVGIPNQNILPGINGSHQQPHQQYAPSYKNNQVQTPIPQNQIANSQQLQQTPSPSNAAEEYPFWPESIKLYDLMKTSIITKINPNKISIDISDEPKKNDLNQKAQFIAYFYNIDKVMVQIKNENKDLKMKLQLIEQEKQNLKQKNEELLRLLNSKGEVGEILSQLDSQKSTNLHYSCNNKDPFNCANGILDWDQELMFHKNEDPSINYFKNTQMLDKKELIPHLNREIREFEREVDDYNQKMEPTFDELIKKVEDIIKQSNPNIKLNKYGSYATKLCLPWSDIDIVVDVTGVTDNSHQSFLNKIEQLLQAHTDLVEGILNIKSATMPVLKVTCTKQYDYKKLDITIQEGKHNGTKCVDLVNNYINAYGHLKPLVLVLKQFLHSLEMNDTYKGGLSSYSLILMLVYFIQQKQSTNDLPASEGELLIQFLLYYGFDEQKARFIAPKKIDQQGGMDQNQLNINYFSNFTVGNEQKIHILDPQNYSNNVAKSSFNYNKIKTAMACSYTIMHTMYVCHACKNEREIKEQQRKPCLILKRLFYLPGKIMDIQDAWVIPSVQQQQYPFQYQFPY